MNKKQKQKDCTKALDTHICVYSSSVCEHIADNQIQLSRRGANSNILCIILSRDSSDGKTFSLPNVKLFNITWVSSAQFGKFKVPKES